ncbi:helix-turn-helix domain-containing protein [Rhizobium sp. RHZ02]|nr:helix-turn-helix domain-containing protein [Rhizobium sp. RHZ02]
MSIIYEGGSRSQVASIGGVGLQIVRDWVERFNLHGPDGLKTVKAKGRAPLLNDEQRRALIEAVEKDPVPYLDGVVRWRLLDLVQWLWQEHRICGSQQTLGRELNTMTTASSPPAPSITRKTRKPSRSLKNFPAAVAAIAAGTARGKRMEIWFQDEARIGQKEQAHAPLGQARNATFSAARSAHQVGLYIRCDLPEARQGRGAGDAVVRYLRHDPASGRNRASHCQLRTRGPHHGSSGLAHV